MLRKFVPSASSSSSSQGYQTAPAPSRPATTSPKPATPPKTQPQYVTQAEFRALAEAVSDLETQLKKLEVRIGECLAAKAKEGLQGKQGLQGEQGLVGEQGPQGDQGPPGQCDEVTIRRIIREESANVKQESPFPMPKYWDLIPRKVK